jgi:hypothetical protein
VKIPYHSASTQEHKRLDNSTQRRTTLLRHAGCKHAALSVARGCSWASRHDVCKSLQGKRVARHEDWPSEMIGAAGGAWPRDTAAQGDPTHGGASDPQAKATM